MPIQGRGEKISMASELAARAEAGRPAEGRKASSRPVDLVHLSRYTLGERELEREVLELFCTQALVYLERLSEATSDQDWREAAHSLKGSAYAIGAWRVAEGARQAEALAGGVLAQLRALQLREIESALREADAYIGSLLKDR
jgi:HPt (histidine-containing phosphotransfer) domain-containing protein